MIANHQVDAGRDGTRGWTLPPIMRGDEQGVEIGALNKTSKRRGKGQKSPLSRIKRASISSIVVSLLVDLGEAGLTRMNTRPGPGNDRGSLPLANL